MMNDGIVLSIGTAIGGFWNRMVMGNRRFVLMTLLLDSVVMLPGVWMMLESKSYGADVITAAITGATLDDSRSTMFYVIETSLLTGIGILQFLYLRMTDGDAMHGTAFAAAMGEFAVSRLFVGVAVEGCSPSGGGQCSSLMSSYSTVNTTLMVLSAVVLAFYVIADAWLLVRGRMNTRA